MSNGRIIILLTRKLSGEASPEELDELSTYLQTHPEDQYLFELVQEYWTKPKDISDHTEDDLFDQHFDNIIEQATEEQEDQKIHFSSTPVINIRKIAKKLSIAAAIILAISVSWIYYATHHSANTNENNEIVAKPGAKSKMILPDGTTVWLNSGSRLTYSGNFNDSIRSVELDGEAFFDVMKDAKHPFIVHTSGIDIRVLGTAFNVKSYATDATIEATLIRGLIEVVKKNQPESPKVILRPHEKLIFNKDQQAITTSGYYTTGADIKNSRVAVLPKEISIIPVPKNKPDTALAETAWIYNKLVVDGETFGEFSKKMERWYNVHIVFQDTKAAEYRFHSVFENESIEEALKALQLIVSFNYKINNNEIKISAK